MGRAAVGLVLALVLLGLTPGCVRAQDLNESEFDPTPPAPPQVTVVRDVVIANRDVVVGGEDDQAAEPPRPLPATVLVWSNIRLGQHEPVLFRLGAGLGALGHIDLNPCRDRGLQSGYVHMHVTFQGTGHVVRAAVETPVAPPPEALSCIGDQIETTMVPVFEGGDVNLSKSFFVN